VVAIGFETTTRATKGSSAHDGPAVCGSFQDDLIFRPQSLAADVLEGRGVHALVAERVDVRSGRVEDVADDQVFVEINPDVACHVMYSV
jgi:hypothetical protein